MLVLLRLCWGEGKNRALEMRENKIWSPLYRCVPLRPWESQFNSLILKFVTYKNLKGRTPCKLSVAVRVNQIHLQGLHKHITYWYAVNIIWFEEDVVPILSLKQLVLSPLWPTGWHSCISWACRREMGYSGPSECPTVSARSAEYSSWASCSHTAGSSVFPLKGCLCSTRAANPLLYAK